MLGSCEVPDWGSSARTHQEECARRTYKDRQICGWLYCVNLDSMLENDAMDFYSFSKDKWQWLDETVQKPVFSLRNRDWANDQNGKKCWGLWLGKGIVVCSVNSSFCLYSLTKHFTKTCELIKEPWPTDEAAQLPGPLQLPFLNQLLSQLCEEASGDRRDRIQKPDGFFAGGFYNFCCRRNSYRFKVSICFLLHFCW